MLPPKFSIIQQQLSGVCVLASQGGAADDGGDDSEPDDDPSSGAELRASAPPRGVEVGGAGEEPGADGGPCFKHLIN